MSHDLLSADREVELAEIIEAGREAKALIEHGNLGAEGMAELRLAVIAGHRARDELVLHNQRLVQSIARRYTLQSHDWDDLLQEGNLGLLQAINNFDWRRGFKFSTYATWWIRAAIEKYALADNQVLHLPAKRVRQRRQVEAAISRLSESGNIDPSLDEVGEATGLTDREILDSWNVPRVVHLDAMAEHIADDSDGYTQVRAVSTIDNILAGLSEKERTVMILRSGMVDGREWLWREIGPVVGVSGSAARQIFERAAIKTRRQAWREDWDGH